MLIRGEAGGRKYMTSISVVFGRDEVVQARTIRSGC